MYNFEENKNVLALFHLQKLLTVGACVLYIYPPTKCPRQVYTCCACCCFYIRRCFKQLYIKLFCIFNVNIKHWIISLKSVMSGTAVSVGRKHFTVFGTCGVFNGSEEEAERTERKNHAAVIQGRLQIVAVTQDEDWD